jgi:hypothetical protein
MNNLKLLFFRDLEDSSIKLLLFAIYKMTNQAIDGKLIISW